MERIEVKYLITDTTIADVYFCEGAMISFPKHRGGRTIITFANGRDAENNVVKAAMYESTARIVRYVEPA